MFSSDSFSTDSFSDQSYDFGTGGPPPASGLFTQFFMTFWRRIVKR